MIDEFVTYEGVFHDLESADNYVVSTMDRLEADGWFIYSYEVIHTYKNTWAVELRAGRNEPGQEDVN